MKQTNKQTNILMYHVCTSFHNILRFEQVEHELLFDVMSSTFRMHILFINESLAQGNFVQSSSRMLGEVQGLDMTLNHLAGSTLRHYSDVTWASWCLKSSATRSFVQPLFQANFKESIKALHHWLFVRGNPDSPHESPVMRKAFYMSRHLMWILGPFQYKDVVLPVQGSLC